MSNKLYVVGEDTPNPEEWSQWNEFSLVIAPNTEVAYRLADKDETYSICEVSLDKPMLLVSIEIPDM